MPGPLFSSFLQLFAAFCSFLQLFCFSAGSGSADRILADRSLRGSSAQPRRTSGPDLDSRYFPSLQNVAEVVSSASAFCNFLQVAVRPPPAAPKMRAAMLMRLWLISRVLPACYPHQNSSGARRRLDPLDRIGWTARLLSFEPAANVTRFIELKPSPSGSPAPPARPAPPALPTPPSPASPPAPPAATLQQLHPSNSTPLIADTRLKSNRSSAPTRPVRASHLRPPATAIVSSPRGSSAADAQLVYGVCSVVLSPLYPGARVLLLPTHPPARTDFLL